MNDLIRTLRSARLLVAAGATLIALSSGTSSWAGEHGGKHESWSWQGAAPATGKLAIHGVNGQISAEPATGNRIEITADKHGRKQDPSTVEIKVVQDSDGISVCAVYPDGGSPCTGRGNMHRNTRNNDVQVDFTVRVPAGLTFDANTVNGAVRAIGLNGPVRAHTVNGECEIETSQSGEASTVNGGVRATIGKVGAREKLDFNTVNGSITLLLPDGIDARLDGSTVNGSIQSDFPAKVSGKWGPRSMTATLGEGGARVNASTVNGSIRVRRSQ
ncbi:MAG: hypothetical protein IT348_12570 [Candidatus Eisenbacteria bacterium]|nr:hypothetical protein [Candidatus Eisenbacteria bacterium]